MVDIITLDGPSGCGKGTISQLLAEHLGYYLLDSGALYRIAGYGATQRGHSLEDTPALLQVIAELDICFNVLVDKIIISWQQWRACGEHTA